MHLNSLPSRSDMNANSVAAAFIERLNLPPLTGDVWLTCTHAQGPCVEAADVVTFSRGSNLD